MASRKQIVIRGVRDYILAGKYAQVEQAYKALISGIEEATRNGIPAGERELLLGKVKYWFRKAGKARGKTLC